MKIYINGEFFEKKDAKVSVFDHGLLYGDGVFEGIRLYEGCVFKLDEHLERLEYSAKAIMLKLPWSREEIGNAVMASCRENKLVNGYIRLVVTRGEGDLGLSPKTCVDPQLIIIAGEIKMYPEEMYERGMKVITVPTRRVSNAALSSHIKSLNYLNNIMAKIEATHLGYAEAIMLNEQGYVAECTGDNVFAVSKGRLLTPNSSDGALKGITREVVKEIGLGMGMEVHVAQMTRYDLWNCEELFLTGTAAEIIPVVEVDARVIGNGKPGAITGRLMKEFKKKVTKEGRKL